MHGRDFFKLILSVSIQEQALESREEFITYSLKIRLGLQPLYIILYVGSLPNSQIRPAPETLTGLYG